MKRSEKKKAFQRRGTHKGGLGSSDYVKVRIVKCFDN
jgi:hypothetical protein